MVNLRNDLFRTPTDPNTRGVWERDVTTFLNNVRDYLIGFGADPVVLGEIATLGAISDERLASLERTTAVQAAFTEGLRADLLKETSRILTFTANGTWRRPSGLKAVAVFCVGGGGGGGGGLAILPIGGVPASSFGGGGGGGGGFSYSYFNVNTMPAQVSITVGAGGAGGDGAISTTPPTDGASGGTSSFGSFMVAKGGGGGLKGDLGTLKGLGATIPGVLYEGGDGTEPGVDAPNLCQGAPGGGGGGTAYWNGIATVTGQTGGDGGAGAWRTTSATGGGGTGGTPGLDGDPGQSTDSDQYLAPGYGGGGGGSSTDDTGGDGGAGGAGVIGGGGGGGGGGFVTSNGGDGGNGGDGRVWVVEFY